MRKTAILVLFGLILLVLVQVADAAGRGYGYSSCGSCYTSYSQPYYPPPVYYPPPEKITYVNSVQLYQPYSFQWYPPTATLQLYGTPNITSTTTTTVTTSSVSNGAVQSITVGGNAPTLTTGGVTTVTPGVPQPIDDGLPIANSGVPPPQPQYQGRGYSNGVAGVLKQYCASCHQGQNGNGGVTLLDNSGNVSMYKKGKPITLADVLMTLDGVPVQMPPASKNDPSKAVPLAQRKVLWEAYQKGR